MGVLAGAGPSAAGQAFVPRYEIKQRIEPRIAGRQRPSDFVTNGDHFHGLALGGLCFFQDEEQRARDVKGQKAQSEQKRDGDDGFDGLPAPADVRSVLRARDGDGRPVLDPFRPAAHPPFLLRAGLRVQRLKNSTHHLRVAPRDDGKREEEAEQVQNDPVGHVLGKLAVNGIVPTVPVNFHLSYIRTSCWPKFHPLVRQLPRHITGFGKSDDGAGKDEHHDPHGSTDASNRPLAVQSDASDRMADAHVAMHGYAGKKEDAAVKIEVKKKTHQSAHEVSKDPMVTHYVARNEERKR